MAIFQVVIQTQAVGSICQTQLVASTSGSQVADSVVVSHPVERGEKEVQGKELTSN